MDDIKISSNKSFGIVFFVVFVVIAFYPLINQEESRLWALVTALIFLILVKAVFNGITIGFGKNSGLFGPT